MSPKEQGSRSFRFSTSAARPADPVSSWNHLFGRPLSRRVVAPPPSGTTPPRMEMTAHVLGGDAGGRETGHVMRMAVSAGGVARRTKELLADGNDDIVLHVQITGRRIVSQCGREATVNPGGAVVTTNAEESTIALSGAARFACIAVPRTLMAARVPRVDDLLARAVPPTRALQLLTRYLGLLDDDEALRAPGLRSAVATHIYDLCALAVGAARDAAEIAAGRGLRAARLHALKQDIAQNLAHGDVSPAALARRHGITRRYVHKLFESEGTTLSRYKLGLRLVRVHEMLTSRAHDELTIAAIAYRAGFGDLSTFNREFRRYFGATPSELRSAARGKERT
ncbi:MAG TPA: AraC family transcriptional regulator [Gammaproteobacteria bacterium]